MQIQAWIARADAAYVELPRYQENSSEFERLEFERSELGVAAESSDPRDDSTPMDDTELDLHNAVPEQSP